MPRKVTFYTRSIMQPHHIELEKRYKAAKQKYAQAREEFMVAYDEYDSAIRKLNAIFEPKFEEAYDLISELDNDFLGTRTPAQVYEDAIVARGYGKYVSKHKFGRMMKELGFYRTTKRGADGRVHAYWRKQSDAYDADVDI